MTHKITKMALSVGVAVVLSACSSTPVEPPAEPKAEAISAFNEGVPGGMELRAVELSAAVKEIDYSSRQVTLLDANGMEKVVTVPADMENFEQIKRGDTVTLTFIEEIVVQMLDEHSAPQESVRSAILVSSAEPGSKPREIIADQTAVKVKVKAVDLDAHSATLEFPDGSTRSVPVRKDVLLDESRVGQELMIYTTKAVAIAVRKH